MKTIAVLFLCLALCGCATIGRLGPAGAVWSRRPYSIEGGAVVKATPRAVLTEWPVDKRFYGAGNQMYFGDGVYHVCPDTVPPLGAFNGARLEWSKARKCWLWESL